jgi:hypothetical protein
MKDGVEVDEQVDVEEQTGSGDELLKTEEVPKQDPIASAIDKLVLRISDIAFSAITFIPKAARWQIDQLKKTSKEIQRNFEVYEGGDDSIKAAALKNIIVLDKNYKRFEKSERLVAVSSG